MSLAGKAVASTSANEVRSLADVEREHIIKTLEKLKGRIDEASEALGVDRETLSVKLREYGIG
jgi:transcriptional regulator of acetoin/glycerol metabolism